MIGKGGFLRILEAFIAVTIIAGVLSFIYVNQVQKPNQNESMHQLLRIVLEDIQNDETLRGAVLGGDYKDSSQEASNNRKLIKDEIGKIIPEELEFDIKICDLNEICTLDNLIKKEIFSDAISVSSTLKEYNPKVIRIFIWEK